MKNLQIRAALFFRVRCFFRERAYLEVETPHRLPSPIPEAHIDAVPSGDWFLHTSPESCMKRLLANGFSKIFQICRVFRQGERGQKHLPEFSMLEWYCVDVDYNRIMDQCENLISYCAKKVLASQSLTYQGMPVNLKRPWARITVKDAFLQYGSMSMDQALSKEKFDEIMAFEIEPRLGPDPVFLIDYPIQKAALARPKRKNPALAERFELYMGGMEIANAFSELTDPAQQQLRFAAEEKERARAGKKPYPPPVRFLDALKHMPESAGIALGLDRLAMLFADVADIDQITAFVPEDL